jgi:hypothetical protein
VSTKRQSSSSESRPTEPPLVAAAQSHRKVRGRQRVVVEEHVRDVNALRRTVARCRQPGARAADAAGGDRPAAGVEQRELAELRKLQHVIGEDAGLLPLREGRGAELLTDRAEDAALLSMYSFSWLATCSATSRLPSRTDGFRAFLEPAHRDEAVDDERQHLPLSRSAARSGT